MPATAQTPFQTAALRQWLQQEIALIAPECAGVFGRQGLFAHDNTHHALAMAYAAVDCLREDGTFDKNSIEAADQHRSGM